ncbi:MAG: hypothetical protein ACYCZN_16365 [Candidatus Dormibacteria bacterium]
MRRRRQQAEPSCPVVDEDVPSCTTGPSGQLRFVARELVDIARSLRRAAGHRDDHSINGESDNPDVDAPSPRGNDGTAQ